jgi:poly(3-hydroxybutyrate) depolymerase
MKTIHFPKNVKAVFQRTTTVIFACSLAFAGPVFVADSALAADVPDLPAYQVDIAKTSVSGLSSGAFMAGQFHVAFSGTVVGVGIIAGGPFYCAGSVPDAPLLETAMTTCMNPQAGAGPDAAYLLKMARSFAQSGEIDPLENLKNSQVYLFSGKSDHTVTTKVVDQTAAFYKLAGVPAQNIRYVENVDAGHSISTDNSKDSPCPLTRTPYINDCHFMQSQDILRTIYGELNPPETQLSGKILSFNQKKFTPSFLRGLFSGMADKGYLYVPKACESETCKVHIAFHGCEQTAEIIDDRYYRSTGYNELADSNHIIVLYPQATSSTGFFSPYNPKGCWDFWGYSSLNPFAPDFYGKNATQIEAVKAMLDQLARPRK